MHHSLCPPRTNTAGQRYCTGCQDYLPVAAFGPDVTRKDGLKTYCRAGGRYEARRDYRRHCERRLATSRAYRAAHPAKMADYQRTKTARRKARQARATTTQTEIPH